MARAAGKPNRREADLSARFTPQEKIRVELAMARTGKNLTDFIRGAVLGSADEVLANDPLATFAGAIGAINVKGDFGRRADMVYAELLQEKHGIRRRRTRQAGPNGSGEPDDNAQERP